MTQPQPSITCPICGRTSYNPTDIKEGFCGYCCEWTNGTVKNLRPTDKKESK